MQMLKDILFDIDEIVDDFATEALQRQVEVHGNKLKEGARKLTSLPEGFQRLTNLRVLEIYSCRVLVLLLPGLRDLPALEELSIDDCEYLHFRDDDFQGLTSLKSLYSNALPLLKNLHMGLQCAAPTLN
ncbi:hypothetical protein LguiA_014343 [Lonicera macranthoides]